MYQLDQATRSQFARERVEELTRAARPAALATTADGRGRRAVVRLTPAAVREHLYRAFVARALVAGVARRAAANDGEDAQCA
jgi:hypothetical protein